MENLTPEEIKKWRKENADKIGIQPRFVKAPDGTMMRVSGEGALTEDQSETAKDELKDLGQ